MALPYEHNFESGIDYDTTKTDQNNTITQSSVKKNSGTFSARHYFGIPLDRDCYGFWTETSEDEVYYRFYVNLDDFHGTSASPFEFGILKVGTTYLGQIRFYHQSEPGGFGLRYDAFNDSGTIKVYINEFGEDFSETAGFVAIEVHLKKATTTSSNDGEAGIWLNGVSLGSVNNLDNNAQFGSGITRYYLGPDLGSSPSEDDIMWFDDVKMDSSFIGLIPSDGWTGKVNGVTNPAKVNGIAVANISKVNGVS